MQEALSASETMFAPNAGFVTLVSKIYSAEEYDIIKDMINCSKHYLKLDRKLGTVRLVVTNKFCKGKAHH